MRVPHDRRLCNIHFNLCLAYQYSNDIKSAMEHCQQAIAVIQRRISWLPQGGKESEKEDLEALLEDLSLKREELEQLETTPQGAELMELLKKKAEMAGTVDGNGKETAEPRHDGGGFDAPKLNADAAGGVVHTTQNLGVVGRGKQRINLAPSASGVTSKPRVTFAPAEKSTAEAKASGSLRDVLSGSEPGAETAAAEAVTHQASLGKKAGKRTLEDLMGGPNGTTLSLSGDQVATNFFDSSAFQVPAQATTAHSRELASEQTEVTGSGKSVRLTPAPLSEDV